MTEFARIFSASCRQITKFCPLALGVLIFLAAPWVRPVVGDGEGPRISYSEMRTSGRPENFYKLEYSADDQVCSGALKRLNRPMAMPPNLKMPHDYAKIDTVFFLGTEENVTWEPRWLIFEDKTGHAGILDGTFADIFNNGHQLRLFRFELGVGRGVIHSIYAASPETQEHLTESDDRVEGRRVVTLLGPVYELKPYQLDFFPTFAQDELGASEYPWAGVFADVIDVEGKRYVLVTSAVEKYRRNRIYLLEFFSHKDRRLVCGYYSEYLFVDK